MSNNIREICFDTETTGFKPEEGHRLLEIGCIELIDGVVTNNNLHIYFNPERDIPEESFKIHGLSLEFLKDKPLFRAEADRILKYLEGAILVAHNAPFDMRFLDAELQMVGKARLKNEVIDSLMIAKNKFPGQKNSLDALCKRFNIDSSRRILHGALLDAELLVEVYLELVDGKEKQFDNIGLTNNSEESVAFNNYLREIKNNEIIKSRNFLTENDKNELHKMFLEKNIPSNLWGYDEE